MTCQFVLNQILNVLFPPEHNLEHVQSKIVRGTFWSKICRAEGYVTKPGFSERKEIHVLVLLGFVGTSKDFLPQS